MCLASIRDEMVGKTVFVEFFFIFLLWFFFFFFFFSSRRRHTRCGRDWSSDVCSSDLPSLGINISIGLANKSFKYPHQNFEEISAFTPMKWHVNLQGNIEVQRRLNQWHIFARAGYQHGLSPVLKSDTFDRKYNKISTIFGVGYSF